MFDVVLIRLPVEGLVTGTPHRPSEASKRVAISLRRSDRYRASKYDVISSVVGVIWLLRSVGVEGVASCSGLACSTTAVSRDFLSNRQAPQESCLRK